MINKNQAYMNIRTFQSMWLNIHRYAPYGLEQYLQITFHIKATLRFGGYILFRKDFVVLDCHIVKRYNTTKYMMPHYENTPIQIYWKFYRQKTKVLRLKKIWYFSYFCTKHRLWVLVRTASRSTHNLCFWAEIKNNIYPVNPSFII